MASIVGLDQTLARRQEVPGLSDRQLAGVLKVGSRTLERWRAGTCFPQHDARQRLVALGARADRLRRTFSTPGAVRTWIRAGSP